MGAVMTGGGGMGVVGYLLEKNLPGGGLGPGVAQGVEACDRLYKIVFLHYRVLVSFIRGARYGL